MDNDRKKWITLSYLVAAGLLTVVLTGFLFKFSARFDLEARIKNLEWMIRIGSLASGLGLFLFLMRSVKVNAFTDEVFVELSRVTWPTTKETTRSTWVVIVMILLAGLSLGLLDILWVWLFKQIL